MVITSIFNFFANLLLLSGTLYFLHIQLEWLQGEKAETEREVGQLRASLKGLPLCPTTLHHIAYSVFVGLSSQPFRGHQSLPASLELAAAVRTGEGLAH